MQALGKKPPFTLRASFAVVVFASQRDAKRVLDAWNMMTKSRRPESRTAIQHDQQKMAEELELKIRDSGQNDRVKIEPLDAGLQPLSTAMAYTRGKLYLQSKRRNQTIQVTDQSGRKGKRTRFISQRLSQRLSQISVPGIRRLSSREGTDPPPRPTPSMPTSEREGRRSNPDQEGLGETSNMI